MLSSHKVRLSENAGTLILGAVFKLIAWCPKVLIDRLAACLCWILVPLLKKEKKRIAQNVQLVKQLPPHSDFSLMFSRQVLRHQIFAGLETIKEIGRPGSIRVEGLAEYEAHAQKALEGGKGFIVVTGHLGTWELVAKYGAMASGTVFHALAKPSKSPAFTRLLDGLRGSMNTNVLWSNSSRLVRDMLTALKKNEPLGFVMDQKPEGRVGYSVDFLGRQTDFVTGPAKIALRSGAPILGVFCVRIRPWHYKIICEPLIFGAEEETPELTLTQLMADRIGEKVTQYPEQWVWNYKRWASAPS